MKNLVKIFSVFMMMIGTFAFGQSKEEIRRGLSEVMIQVKHGTQNEFLKTKSFEGFKYALIHQKEASTKEGEAILRIVYEFHSKKTSDREILTDYNGKEIAYGVKKLKDLNQLDNESVLFTKGDIKTKLISKRDYPCKWYQLRCHLVYIFGGTIMDTILLFTGPFLAGLFK